MFEKYGFENEKLVAITISDDNIVIVPSEKFCENRYADIYLDFTRAVTLVDTNHNPFILLNYMEYEKSQIDAILFRKVGDTYEISFAEDSCDGLEVIPDYEDSLLTYLSNGKKEPKQERGEFW